MVFQWRRDKRVRQSRRTFIPLMSWLLFSKYELIYDDYNVYSYEWYYLGVRSPCPKGKE
jgi:hypothetical protein